MKKFLFLVFIGILFMSCQSPVDTGFTEASVPNSAPTPSFSVEDVVVTAEYLYGNVCWVRLTITSPKTCLKVYGWELPAGVLNSHNWETERVMSNVITYIGRTTYYAGFNIERLCREVQRSIYIK